MPFGDIFGLVAGAVSTGSLIPQIIRVFKLKSAREISILFTSLMLVGVVLWLIYGIYSGSFPLKLWNSVAGVLTGTLLYAKLKYG
ncbi:MAG TPA: PQ-loop domain-containing transporter [Dehalococcoidales bacterium]